MQRHYLVLSVSLAALAAAAPLAAQSPIGTPCSSAVNGVINYGGSGIPTDLSYCGMNTGPTIIALSATQRYTSPAPTTTGNGVYNAAAGESTGGPSNAGFSTWNFDYYVGTAVGAAGNTNTFTLFADLDPSAGVGFIPWATFVGDGHDSSNLGYFPIAGVFDPSAAGTYSFLLEERNANQALIDQVAINVTVGGATVAPEPASFALMAAGMIGIAGFARRRNKRSAV